MLNKGFLCNKCGPIPTSKKVTISKVQRHCCPDCSSPVTDWERPLKERSGRCGNCGNASFKSAYHNRMLLRCCKSCDEVVNIDKNMEVVRRGNNIND